MIKSVQDYVHITKLSKEKQSEIFEKKGKGYFYEHHGASTCVFHNGEPMCYIGYVEFAPLRSRGNHYHLKKHENICIISGKMIGRFLLPNQPENAFELELHTGDIIHIAPGCAHSFFSVNGAVAVEYSPEQYERSDTIRYSFKWENEEH